MSKNKTIITLASIAALCSAAVIYFIYTILAPARETVYVFNDNYNTGTQLVQEMLTPIQVDAQIVTAGKGSDISSQFVTSDEYASLIRSGDSLRMNVSKGMPLTSAMLSVAGGSIVEMNMRSDMVAVTVPVNNIRAITPELKEGAYVNVYAALDGGVKLIQQNKRILEVYKDETEVTGVAIEENIDESMELIYAASYGSVYLGLIDATGYQSLDGDDPYYPDYLYASAEDNETLSPSTFDFSDVFKSDYDLPEEEETEAVVSGQDETKEDAVLMP